MRIANESPASARGTDGAAEIERRASVSTQHEPQAPEGFVKLYRSRDTYEMMRDPKLFTLLAQISLRVRWSSGVCLDNLQIGEALIGDHKSVGLSRQEYRTRLAKLERLGFATIQSTKRGTRVLLLRYSVFDPLGNHRGNHQSTISQPSANHQPTINEEGKEGEEGQEGKERERGSRTPDLEDVKRYFKEELGSSISEAERYHDYYSATGWRRNGDRIVDWESCARNWVTNDRSGRRNGPKRKSVTTSKKEPPEWPEFLSSIGRQYEPYTYAQQYLRETEFWAWKKGKLGKGNEAR